MWTFASSHDTKLPLRQIFSVACMAGGVLSPSIRLRDGTGSPGMRVVTSIPPMAEVDHEQARSFDRVAETYARARPGYPAAAVEWLLAPAPGRRVVDLAAGTGKLTQVLAAA